MGKKYKTNINCASCVAKVQVGFDELVGKENWNVDTTTENKILTINTTNLNEVLLIKTAEKLGYKIEPLQNGFINKIKSLF